MNPSNKVRVLGVLVLAVAAVAGCERLVNEASTTADNTAMIRAYVDAANRGDATYLDAYLGPDYVFHGAGGDLDAEGFRAFHTMVLSAFPGATFTIDDLIATGDKVVTRWTLHGMHQGAFQGIPPTGRAVTVTGIIISRFANGRAVEEWEEADILGMMQQLGVMAPPATEGP